MRGLIDNRQVATHFGLIWREFGWRCALRCLNAMLHGRPTTFLDLAFDTGEHLLRTPDRVPRPPRRGRGGGPAFAPRDR